LIRTTSAPQKVQLPWLKLAGFGTLPTAKGSLRWDGNVHAVSGIEADYDGERLSFEAAVEILEKAGVEAIVYTSPSHTPEKPRWRVLCPLSIDLPPKQRPHMLGRLAGLFKGIFSAESWALSQSYYFGAVDHNPAHQVALVEGMPIDRCVEFDRIAVGKPQTEPKAGNGLDPLAGPANEAALLEEIRTGHSYHQSAIRLLGLWAHQGIGLIEAEKRLREAFDGVFPPDRDERWQARVGEIPKLLECIYGKEFAKPSTAPPDDFDARASADDGDPRKAPLILISPVRLQDQPVPERQWLVRDWIPMHRVTGLYGEGGEGKTLLLQMLATACAIDARWLGLPVRPCRSLLLYCEDDLEDMHIRQEAINRHYGCGYAELGNMLWLPRLGDDNTLMNFDHARAFRTTLFDHVLTEAKAFGAQLVAVDTLADVFGGNEIERSQARKFVQECLAMLARELGAAELVSAHPSLAGMSTGRGTSGSTGWRATFRSLLYLETPEPEDENEAPDPYARILTRKKANYATRDDTIELVWKEGVFVAKNARTSIIASIEKRSCERVTLDLVAKLTIENQTLSANPHAGNYAPKIFMRRPTQDREGFKSADFALAIQSLLSKGGLINVQYGRPSDPRYRSSSNSGSAISLICSLSSASASSAVRRSSRR
jgi:hypothetical protein